MNISYSKNMMLPSSTVLEVDDSNLNTPYALSLARMTTVARDSFVNSKSSETKS